MRRVSAPDLPSCSPVSPDETLSPGSPRATALPAGVRDVLPAEWKRREHLRQHLFGLLRSWGYEGVDLPALELADPAHPQGDHAFKLIDSGGQVLALRSEYTTALGRLVGTHFPSGPFPLRLQYGGRLWLRTQTSELGRLREFNQVGAELIGVTGVQADTELLALAHAALGQAGVQAQLEVGFPGFVDAVLTDAGLTEPVRAALHDAIDRKSGADLDLLARRHGVAADVTRTLHSLTELYGGPEVLAAAQALARGVRAEQAVAHLGAVHAAARDAGVDLLFDLGVSRRYGYYTGLTFRAYVEGINQPVLGGGRYALPGGLPGAGFAIGLERLAAVLPAGVPSEPETVLALDFAGAAAARAAGLRAELAWTDDGAELRHFAQARGLRRWVQGADLRDVTPHALTSGTEARA
ncbi:ATP phosphoribosyltransferase regulatory subunit [Deinococcus wulumuqiensis]|uniref:ATP phosphoribosyltransferase regulatory subunit n=1 Tax=Deinococcus wulumuqiensis TaxID=980427 RepID=A0A345IFT5_9DEIO|nr:ATP phosphoribosyltransferase regulatory subunit [Deinococcus wulumuqiensis]AXG98557.1 ATP phosphoribosyltransferase regulatory subunit [Deinococcus wulumuqiensis]